MTDRTPEFSSSERKDLYVLIRQREPDTDLTKLEVRTRKMTMKDVIKHLNVDDLKLDSEDDDKKEEELEKKKKEPEPTPTPSPCSNNRVPDKASEALQGGGNELRRSRRILAEIATIFEGRIGIDGSR
jgi:hypothetical protein